MTLCPLSTTGLWTVLLPRLRLVAGGETVRSVRNTGSSQVLVGGWYHYIISSGGV